MAVTQKQIAQALGVSRSLVGEALGNHPKISEATRQKVLDMAQELGYDPQANAEARSLVGRRYGHRIPTHVMGLVLSSTDATEHFVGTRLFAGIHPAVSRHGYDLLVLERDRLSGFQGGGRLAREKRIDGLVLANATHSRPLLDTLAQEGVLTVTCLSDDNPPEIPSIMANNAQGMDLAVGHLVELGHTKIGHLTGPQVHSDAVRRLEGFRKAMQSRGLKDGEESIIWGDWWGGTTSKVVQRIVDQKYTAVVCANDLQALFLWGLLEEMGYSVPGDVSLTGFDNSMGGETKGLTTITNPLAQIGGAAVDTLLQLFQGRPAHELSRLVEVDLIVRSSTAGVRA